MKEDQTSSSVSETPIVGVLPVMDPRIDPELERKMLGYLALEGKVHSLGGAGGLAGPGRFA